MLVSRVLGLKRAWVSAHSGYSRGVSILIHRSLHFQLLDLKIDPEGRYIMMHAIVFNAPLVLVGLYLPPPTKVSVPTTVMQKVMMYDVDDVLIMGILIWLPLRIWIGSLVPLGGSLAWPSGWACLIWWMSGDTFIPITLHLRSFPVTWHPSGRCRALTWSLTEREVWQL